jgi:hypothetical protein
VGTEKILHRCGRWQPSATVGAAYLAVGVRGSLNVYEFPSGKLMGSAPLVPHWHTRGFSFSPDGRELVLLYAESGHENNRMVGWDTTTGAVTLKRTIGPFTNAGNMGSHGEQQIEWFNNGKGWLLAGRALVDRASGKERWTAPERKPANAGRVIGDRLLMVQRRADSTELTSQKIPADSPSP